MGTEYLYTLAEFVADQRHRFASEEKETNVDD